MFLSYKSHMVSGWLLVPFCVKLLDVIAGKLVLDKKKADIILGVITKLRKKGNESKNC